MPTVLCPSCHTIGERTATGTCARCGESIATGEATVAVEAADETRTQVPAANAPTIDPAATPPVDPRRWSVPGYEVLGELGRGGMGVVYRARDLGLDRVIALKVLLAGGHAGPIERARFRAEAEAAAALRHPHTVQVFRVGEHQGLPFLALELVPGGTLADRLKAGPLAVRDAVQMVEKAARGVQTAHAAGIAHRDLKPANILLTADGEPKVADFGLVQRQDSELTASGAVMGTPAYMSPEQARGDTKAVGPAADVWALGTILFECFTGRPPFKAESPAETIRNVLERDPPAIRRMRPEVPKDLEAIGLKCLEKDPRRRYASAGELADDLGRFSRGEPVGARPPTVWNRLARRAAKYRVPAALAAAVLIAGAGTALVLSWGKPTPPPVVESPGGLPVDLAAVPPDAVMILSVRVAEGWKHPGVQAVAQDFLGLGDDKRLAAEAENWHRLFGLPLDAIERATLVSYNGLAGPRKGPDVFRGAIIVRSREPIDLSAARHGLETMFAPFDRKDRGNRWYLESPPQKDMPALALVALTDREVAFGTAQDVVAMIDRIAAEPVSGPLTPAIEAAAAGRTVALGIRPSVEFLDQALGTFMGFGKRERQSHLGNLIRAFGKARTAIATLDLLPAQADHELPGLDAVARFDFEADTAAADGEVALREMLKRMAATEIGPNPIPLEAALSPGLRSAVADMSLRRDGLTVHYEYRPRWSKTAWNGARQTAVRTESERARIESYNRIGLALHMYEQAKGSFPPAIVRDKSGKPLRSWRVDLLPYIGDDLRYRRLKLDEPWDSPHNKPRLDKVPALFAEPDLTGPQTRAQAVLGPQAVFGGPGPVKMVNIIDGSSNTLLVVEAAEPVHWAEPKDLGWEPGKIPPVGRPGADTFLALMAEGRTHRLPTAIRPEVFAALATRNGKELINWSQLTTKPGTQRKP